MMRIEYHPENGSRPWVAVKTVDGSDVWFAFPSQGEAEKCCARHGEGKNDG